MGRCCEVDLPVLKKFLFCLPLRPGLFAYGFLQMMATLGILIFSAIDFTNWTLGYRYSSPALMTLIFMACAIYSIVDFISCIFLMRGAHKKNYNFLELFFHYQRYKVMLYAFLLIICFLITILSPSYDFFYYNFDAVRCYLLRDNIAVGILDWILQFYVLLLVRSELLNQEHVVVDLPTLFGRMKPSTSIHGADEIVKQPQPEGYIQYH